MTNFGQLAFFTVAASRRYRSMCKLLPSCGVYALLLALVFCGGCRPQNSAESQGKSLRFWEKEAASTDVAKRRAAASSLGQIGPKGLPALVKLLHDPDHDVRAVATVAVVGMGPAAIPELKRLSHDADPQVQQSATKSLMAALTEMRDRGVRPLIDLLKDPEPRVRASAARALVLIDRRWAREALPALKELASDEDREVQKAAAFAVKIIEPFPERTGEP